MTHVFTTLMNVYFTCTEYATIIYGLRNGNCGNSKPHIAGLLGMLPLSNARYVFSLTLRASYYVTPRDRGRLSTSEVVTVDLRYL